MKSISAYMAPKFSTYMLVCNGVIPNSTLAAIAKSTGGNVYSAAGLGDIAVDAYQARPRVQFNGGMIQGPWAITYP